MATQNRIPDAIRAAAAGMLAPFGVNLDELLNAGKNTTAQAEARYLSVADVEEVYGLKRWTLHRLIKAGKIIAAKTAAAKSGKVLVEADSIERFLRASRTNRRARA